MTSVGEMLDQGVKAYTRGATGDAMRYFAKALELDPFNERARAYLQQLQAELGAGHATAAPDGAGAGEVAAPPPGSPSAPPASPGRTPSPWDEGPATAATIVLDHEEGLELRAVEEKSDIRPLVPEREVKAQASTRKEVDVWMDGARELFALGDFSGSLEVIEKILRQDPDHEEARAYLQQNEATLIAMYESKLGPLTGIPRLAISPEEVMWLNLDHRAGFLLAQVDGAVNYDELFALSGLPRLDTARILATLLANGVIR